MTKVIVLSGGTSNEREVSLRSGKAVAEALKTSGYDVQVLDSNCTDEELKSGDVVFPVLHGVGGEDGQTQARFDSLGIKYVGSGAESSKLCMDKGAYRQKMVSAGFLMAEGEVVDAEMFQASPLAKAPFVLKPISGGSSIDTFIVRNVESFDMSTTYSAFERNQTMLLESLIEGVEVTVGILGDQALPVIEIIPPENGEFDYENKYNGETQELLPPPHVSEELQVIVQDLALKAHQAANCRDFSRSDFIITNNGDCYLLETNTIPGMTDQSLFPKMAKHNGIDMPELCSRLVKLAQERL